MNKYILDTNTVSYYADDMSLFHSSIVENIARISDNDRIFLSILTLYELQHGIAAMDRETSERFNKAKNLLLKYFEIIPLSIDASEIYGALKTDFIKQTGITKEAAKRHDIDFMIAASAISENAILVSNDRMFTKFESIYPNFLLENWAS